jgi:hypothetical protein
LRLGLPDKSKGQADQVNCATSGGHDIAPHLFKRDNIAGLRARDGQHQRRRRGERTTAYS